MTGLRYGAGPRIDTGQLSVPKLKPAGLSPACAETASPTETPTATVTAAPMRNALERMRMQPSLTIVNVDLLSIVTLLAM